MTRDGEPDEELPNNVIAFPKPKAGVSERVEPAEASPGATPLDMADEATPSGDGADAAEPPDDAEGPTMTLDAFERAVRAAVRDKLGEDEPSSPPRGADELVAQVFSALTGKDARSALAEVRSRLAEPLGGPETSESERAGDDADVIDLASIREARQRQSAEAGSLVGHAIKDTLTGFISTIAQRQGHTGEITLDANFLKQHGPTLLGNLFQSLAATFMQQARTNLGTTGPTAPRPETAPTEAPDASATPPGAEPPSDAPQADAGATTPEPEAKPTQPVPVQVRLDVGSILSGLFKRFARPPQPPDEPQG